MDGVRVPGSANSFSSFGDLLKFLRRRAHLTQLELSIAVGYSEAQISRLEQSQRLPDPSAVQALFIPALQLENEPGLAARLLELAHSARQEDAPLAGLPPYKGLLFFEEADAGLFFGRESLTAHLVGHVMDLAREATTRFLTVVGASGSGKSSLVRAGLAVELKRAGWDIRLFTPTSIPIWTMERNLNSMIMLEKERILVLVDQFEEIFTLCRDEMERIQFIERLVSLAQEVSGRYFVVIALRADFYSHCSQYPLLRQVVAEEQEYIGQMTAQELRCAIEEPAKRGGWELEPGLVDVLLQDVGAHRSHEPEPGALPLLSHALLVTWQRRRGRTLTLRGYQGSGGVRGAIAETAESVFTDQLDQEQQKLARDVFLRLTELGEGTEDTRRLATLNELVHRSAEAAKLRSVLNILAEARLITLNENTVEVAHEALIREWQRLREWLMHNREALLLHRHLTESSHEWQTRGRDPSDLYRGPRLAQVREWASENEEKINDSERDFLAASIKLEERNALEHQAQRLRELVAARELADTQSQAAAQLKERALFLNGAFTLAILLSVIAIFFWHQASQNALKAQSRELAAAAISNLGDDPERSILLSLQALQTSHTLEAENALHRSILESRVKFVLHHGAEVWSVTYSRDGRRIGTASQDKLARIWDAETGELLLILTGHKGSVNGIAFSPDGKRVATCSNDRTAKVWDVTTGEELLTFSGHTNSINRIAFSPDGNQLATTSQDQTAKIWDAFTGRELLTIPGNGEVFYDVAYSQDGQRIAISGENPETHQSTVRIWDATTGRELLTLPINGGHPRGVAFSPDDTRVAATSTSFPNGKIWDAATGNILLDGFPEQLYGLLDITFSLDGALVATGGSDQKAIIRNTRTGQVLYVLSGHTNSINSVAFSPDMTRLATASLDDTVRVWDITPARESIFIPALSYGANALISSPDGSQAMSIDASLTRIIIQNAYSGKELFSLERPTRYVIDAFYSPDGRLIAAAYDDGQYILWNAKTGKETGKLAGRMGIPCKGVFSPDGSSLASEYNGKISIQDVGDGKVIQTLQWHDFTPTINIDGCESQSMVYSPDSLYLVSGDINGFGIVWDVRTGEKLMTLIPTEEGYLKYSESITPNPKKILSITYSPDGRYVALARQLGSLTIFNTSTGSIIMTLKSHGSDMLAVGFSPDGRQIATSSMDGTTRVWDTNTGQNTLMLPISGSYISFSQNGKELVIGNSSGLYGFVVPTDDLIRLAKSRVTRTLSTDECQQYLHVAACPAQ
jgi:WD40 repeat protein/transcriptional regulator with XRE-family HTH domain